MTIRQARNDENDIRLTFGLSNDPAVRNASFSKGMIGYDSHRDWYRRTVSDTNVLFFLVFEDESEREFVGQLRFKRSSEEAEECVISLSITEQFRGKGIGARFLELGVREMGRNWKLVKKVVAEVKAGNVASNRLFTKEGFEMVSSVNTYERIMDLPS